MTQLVQCIANEIVERMLRDLRSFIDVREDDLGIAVTDASVKDDSRSATSPQNFKLVELIATGIEHTLKGSSYPTLNINS
jgi:hypothetical protein